MTSHLHIRPIAKRNYLVFSLAAVLGFISSILMQQLGIKLPSYLIMICSLICAVFGIAKRLEPEFSFTLDENHFTWHLKHSDITIAWNNVIKLTPLTVNTGQGKVELNYLGLKLWDISPIVNGVSVRTAKNLFHEYRSILHVALMEAEYRQDDVGMFQEDADGWVDHKGKKHIGVKGMFASRLQQIKSTLGADLYIPITSLDRNVEDFIQLFDNYKKHADEHKQSAIEKTSQNVQLE